MVFACVATTLQLEVTNASQCLPAHAFIPEQVLLSGLMLGGKAPRHYSGLHIAVPGVDCVFAMSAGPVHSRGEMRLIVTQPALQPRRLIILAPKRVLSAPIRFRDALFPHPSVYTVLPTPPGDGPAQYTLTSGSVVLLLDATGTNLYAQVVFGADLQANAQMLWRALYWSVLWMRQLTKLALTRYAAGPASEGMALPSVQGILPSVAPAFLLAAEVPLFPPAAALNKPPAVEKSLSPPPPPAPETAPEKATPDAGSGSSSDVSSSSAQTKKRSSPLPEVVLVVEEDGQKKRPRFLDVAALNAIVTGEGAPSSSSKE